MPAALIRALLIVKRASAQVNVELKALPAKAADAIIAAADEALAGRHDGEFPLAIWQTGSGTQTNMNVNEVLANRASELLGGARGEGRLVHPNDQVNRGQSSNDVFPTAMNVAAAETVSRDLMPALNQLQATLEAKAAAFAGIVKIGRTHLQDATPLTLGQEFSGYAAQLAHAREQVAAALPHVLELALGGTAVAPGSIRIRNSASEPPPPSLAIPASPFITAPNKFEAMAAADALVNLHGALKALAASLTKIANDVRWLSSGPRSGWARSPSPRTSPAARSCRARSNPTQCEAMTMLCAQVMGNDVAVAIGRRVGELRAQRLSPLDHPQCAAEHPPARRWNEKLRGALCARHRAQPRAHR